ncbi:LysR family transcriptional regulator [Anabaena sp. FACHB-709]|uniref:Nitrogen assimilation transcriptional activator n=3 Tax=Nostocaceae TaxID=1162 RepID=Q9L3R4_NOSS1|nr:MULTISPECIES: LysR family transcriptional regulator [Nostocaceae]8H3V_S Chain S, NtcB [Anabaena]8H3V_T Chain T, NtcB [Anabaena]8H3V_U Chain U, NtcB [Anabaena]8H3V_V Chain V, NtcB [Anabaena]BAY71576.1 nitrogen assimilation transcriptional activator [Trichormus variabilis NIES-23]HBW31090.1 LysR family transcriptional regulator [Nostoc sp. UBA8866]MBD2172430.1 LysR family transcriptional regulator [Anabaena cylindrica FACHB-318]MBD2264102.1 LysR family transcriptional regulator [Anabaena s
MRLEQLQAFLAIAETGSFQKAASKCGVTQSTISRQIQSLEADLGLELFHRTNHSKLTLGGERLLPRARKICLEWETATQELGDLIAGKQPELCIAAIHSLCGSYLPPVLQKFCRDYPEVQLRVTSLGSDRALKVLKDGLVDLAIVMNNRFLTTGRDMVVEVLYDEPIELLTAANHPLAAYERVPWSELVRYPQVVFKDGYGMQRLVQEKFERLEATLQAALEVNTLDAFRGVVRQGELIALLPSSALVEARLDPTLAVRPLANSALPENSGLTRRVVMVTTQDRLQIPPIKHFWQLVRENIPPIVERQRSAS